ncbi:MAG: Crp/Fnr family transcriptional regulator [Anaerolineales bacterium]|uniref:Crp/Fnr family transcriptional regulator n=1 Tax=Candidatus Villigracilis affinis TaxID=3140682 RepID=UPI001DC49103|nr:Crp/Fnr family transcriptional regulator [Anaerolineales bacterium]MBK9603438.1 Crp/Fnr family transcriptional regulator [Anaerolineales bacterium]MBL0346588.1 Crp/Fnr family transcriptional regulator [Anaerolineales bacterium]
MEISIKDLKQVVVFQNATDDDLRLILQNSITRSVEEGGFFFFQGDSAEYLYVLASGQVKLMQANPNGQQVNLRTIYPWQMFGALGAVRAEASYPASAQTLEDSTALAIHSKFLHSMLETRPYLSFDLMNLMTAYIQEMQARYRELATERVEQRVANALIRLAGQAGIRSEKDAAIELSFSRQDVAEMTGSTLFTVSRLFSEWERQGIIKTGRERIRILKPHELVRIADGV